jgi:hypothetical protein
MLDYMSNEDGSRLLLARIDVYSTAGNLKVGCK